MLCLLLDIRLLVQTIIRWTLLALACFGGRIYCKQGNASLGNENELAQISGVGIVVQHGTLCGSNANP